MRLTGKKPRWSVLAVAVVVSVVLGTVLGRAYAARVEAEPGASLSEEERREAAALMAEAMDLEKPPAPVKESSPEKRADTARHFDKPARTGQVALRARMPVPPQSSAVISIGDRLDAHGVPMNLAAYETKLSARDILIFYARHFESQAWPYSDVKSARDLVPYPALSATLVDEDVQLTVMVMPHGDGDGNTVVLGQADMEAFFKGTAKEDTGDLPVYPGSEPVAIRSQDEGSATLTVSFDTHDAPARVEEFYRKALAQRGYSEVQDSPESGADPEGPRTMHFSSRQGLSWNLALSAQGTGTAVTAHGTKYSEVTP